jgi:acyl-CoA synthetase (AMP-forming)/AMP-acid ligase II
MIEPRDLTVAPGNIAATLTAMASRQPDALAIVHPARGAQLTFRELDADTDRIARGLRSSGLRRGARVAVMVKPGIDFFAVMFGLFKAGLVPVMIDPGIGLKPLKTCLAEAEPEAFIGIPAAQAARIVLGWARRSIREVITVGPRYLWGGRTLDQIRRLGAQGDPVMEATTRDEIAAILFTSGSTGIPKGAIYRHGNFIAQVEMIRQTYGIAPGEVDLPTFPPFALFDPALGMTTIVPDMDASRPGSVNPEMLVELLERFHVTNMFGSPAVLNRLVGLGRPLPKTLRRVLSAGAPVRPAILDGMKKILPPDVQVFTPYGATESLPVASIGSAEILSDTRYRTDEGAGICVGRPVDGVQVSIVGISDEPILRWQDARLLKTGEVGEIVVRSPTVTSGYFRRDQQTALAKISGPNGEVAHRMGDVGFFDDAGRLWYCGRKSHRVVLPETTLFTEQVEGIFNAATGLRTALVSIQRDGAVVPVICLEWDGVKPRLDGDSLLQDVARKHPLVKPVRRVLNHIGRFPVDIRHNAKIFREQLAVWAARQPA